MKTMGKTAYLGATLLIALVVGTAASAAGAPGVTSSSILIGGTTPLSGPASAYASVAKGADAYFKYVNDHGGVNGRQIKYKYLDDAYDPSQTVSQTRELVQHDKVFAIFNTLGTETNQAIRGYLNQLGVPQLFVASGASTWGSDYKKYPWTIGYQPNYVAEGTIYGRSIARSVKRPKIAILYQNDDYGKELISGLKRGLGSKSSKIVAKQGYDVTDQDVQSQIARLKSSHANVFMIFATPKFAIQSYAYANRLGWRPKIFVNAVSSAENIMALARLASSNRAVEGTTSIISLKDPTDSHWSRDPGIKLYKAIMKKYNSRGNSRDVYNVYGMSVAHTMVATLKQAGKNPSRSGAIKAAAHLSIRNDPFLLPGIVVHTTATNRFPLGQAKLERYHNGRWAAFGSLVSVR